jgi:hypothetical protein
MVKAPWLGIDGEGIGRFPHRYVMLCCNDAEGKQADYIEDVNGLSTKACLDWLLMLPDGYQICGYYLSYDWTKILTDLPNKDIYRLLRPERRLTARSEGGYFTKVRWGKFSLHYLAGMMRIQKGDAKVTIWDVGKFFQARFAQALETSGLAPTELIKRLKGERGTKVWDEEYLDTIREYCLEECRYLAMLINLLTEQHEAIGLRLKAWHGPGSTAKALLAKHHIDQHLAKSPPEVEAAAHSAYFGGRFEQSVLGERAGVWAYDIRSAYPHGTFTLPCLAHGQWVHRKQLPSRDAVAMIRYRVTDIGDRAWGPLPCRLVDGSIVWPRGGSHGWVWANEFWPAVDHWTGVEYGGEAWVWEQTCVCQPFRFMAELYEWRVSRPENKQVVKLASNSVYGSIAQTVGGGGKFSSRVWAGMITASCRARMLELITQHYDEENVYAIATDGAFSSEYLNIDSSELGGWEVSEKGNMVFLRPGIYWATKDIKAWYNEPSESTIKLAIRSLKARGVGRRHMLTQIRAAVKAVENGDERANLGTTTLFGGARSCVYRVKSGHVRRSRLYGEWFDSPATLSLRPQPKRDDDWRPPMLDNVESKSYNSKHRSAEAEALKIIGSLLESRL